MAAVRGRPTAPTRVRFVVAAGPSIGRGHLGRGLSLAAAAWPPGTELELALEGDVPLTEREAGRLRAAGGRLVELSASMPPATVVVVDVPKPDAVARRFAHGRLVVFDDREAFAGSAELVIQPSLPTWSGRAAAGRLLAGYEYAPVSAEARRRRASTLAGMPSHGAQSVGRLPTVLACFGGSDPDRVTARLAPALAEAVDGVATLEIVIGASYAGSTDGWPVGPIRDPADLVDRLARAHLVVSGAGTMKFEVACLGRPMLLVAVADDQRPVGPAFAATGAARYLGDGRTIDPGEVEVAVRALLDDDAGRSMLGVTAARVVDGAGADRIASAIVEIAQATGSS